ncbi:zeta toxin family protein [Methylonatrum kenyense]|uniref:zeta toxin family protein n=1 Tax=Methylonatrum kenyense TaxID=455253 RepID=UPI0020BDCFDA|nr:zeta toxin family protein [Methylonatrum kenyense]MCK8517122.1 zeta toxin family protein [Methylonatrum kenyense]
MADRQSSEFSAWHPGLEADLPARYKPLETIHRSANVATSLSDIPELMALTGLEEEELVTFRAERLVLHELIVQVTADVVVLEGEEEELLGQHFRGIALKILSDYLAPHLPAFQQEFDQLYEQIHDRVGVILAGAFAPEPATTEPEPRSWFARWFSRRRPPRPPADTRSIEERHLDLTQEIKEKGLAAEDKLERAIFKSAYRVLNAIGGTQGHIGVDRELLATLITRHVCNDFGSRHLGRQIAPHVERAIEVEGYERLPCAREPVLISLKGASASGKSSLRPFLKGFLRDLGIQANEYGTVSPDIWRRLLLDYEALGEAYKYAGRLAGKEVKLVDAKLDRYIRDKAERDQSIPHLLIDRFRFDSFAMEKVPQLLDATYAKYIATMYFYFIITPPEATVERGWERGLTRGRYKAVEDFLGHCVEAYDGMPKLLFKWLDSPQPRLEYHFLDNSVAKHTPPTTIAHGNREVLHILDPLGLVDIDRFQKINIHATRPEDVYPDDHSLAIARNCTFIRQCLAKVPAVRFVDTDTGRTYLQTSAGRFSVVDAAILRQQRQNNELAELFTAIGAPET